MPNQPPWVHLSSGDLSCEVDPLGAQLSMLRDSAARDLLWEGNPAFWTGRAPVLFPIVGELAGGAYRLGSQSYALPRHGFARHSRFEILDSSAASAAFRLQANAATLPLYPFRFELEIRFAVIGPALTVTAGIRNTGDVDLPASFGFHPALRWPLPFGRERALHAVEFARDESARVRRLDARGLLLPDLEPTPVQGRRLVLTDALFANDALIFDRLESRSVTYGADGGPRLRMDFSDSPYFALWSKPGAEFICLEPWHGLADPQGFSGDFTTKPGIFIVAPGAVRQIAMTLTLLG